MLKKLFLNKALAIINAELELLNLKIKHPNQFNQAKEKILSSPLYLTDETHLVEIMEMISGLFLTKRVVTHTGKESPLTEIGRTFEWLFNIKIGDCYQKHEDVIKRKPGKLTEFLNGLAELIRKEHDKKGYR